MPCGKLLEHIAKICFISYQHGTPNEVWELIFQDRKIGTKDKNLNQNSMIIYGYHESQKIFAKFHNILQN